MGEYEPTYPRLNVLSWKEVSLVIVTIFMKACLLTASLPGLLVTVVALDLHAHD